MDPKIAGLVADLLGTRAAYALALLDRDEHLNTRPALGPVGRVAWYIYIDKRDALDGRVTGAATAYLHAEAAFRDGVDAAVTTADRARRGVA